MQSVSCMPFYMLLELGFLHIFSPIGEVPYFLTFVPGLEDIKSVICSDDFSLALGNDGTLWKWGHMLWEKSKLKEILISTEPYKLSGLNNVSLVAARWQCAIVLKEDGSLWEVLPQVHQNNEFFILSYI